MKYAGIEQTDWHENQILCIPSSPAHPDQFNFELVLIDFAFAQQMLGDFDGTSPTTDVWRPLHMLENMGYDSELVREIWGKPSELEY